MKRSLVLIMIFCYVLLPLTALAAGPSDMNAETQKWASVNIDSSFPETVTAESINAVLSQKGKSEKAKSGEVGKAIMEAGTANGINPAIMYAMFAIETGWGESDKFTLYNNPGGIKCKSGFECFKSCDTCASWTKFNSLEQGFQVKAEILRTYIDEHGIKTIQQMLERYAPPSDNNDLYSDSGYIAKIGNIIEGLNVTGDDFEGTLTGTGGTYADGGEVGKWKKYDFFMSSDVYAGRTGIDDGQNQIPAEVSYAFSKFSFEASKKMVYLGTVLCLGLLFYISLMIMSYTLIIKGKTSGNSIFTKMVKIDGDIYSRKTIFKIFVQVFLGIAIICLYLTGMYLRIMALMYSWYEVIIYYLFG